ncbi:MAG TPA: hypothetical protein VK100_05015 [Pseudogracilibacillus sp.]|nr:hypothetical protein [Pseudogracilibacillus sp.]
MKSFAMNFGRLIVSYIAVILVIMLMPVFLVTNEVSVLDSMFDFIFHNNHL